MKVSRKICNWVLVLLVLQWVATPLCAQSLSVFYPSIISVQDRQRMLKDETDADTLIVYSKYREFSRQQKRKPADWILVPASHIRFNMAYSCPMQFLKNGVGTFSYQLVASDQKWNKSGLTKGIIGVVDELGRANMKTYVQALLGSKKYKKLKLVTKVEDLFSLLALGSANYILVQPDQLQHFQSKFSTKLFKVAQSTPESNPILCKRKDVSSNWGVEEFTGLGKNKLKVLGFSGLTKRM